jgi:L-asparaginase
MRIQVFTTGGTIDKVYFDARSEYHVGDPQIAAILHDVGADVDFTVETVFRKDSLDLSDADRTLLAEKVQASECERILITHGTDTMVETAAVLSRISDKVVVLVGSLSPARFKSTDAEFNIGFALAAAELLPHGVYIAMNGRVFRHDAVRKNRSANRFESA